MFNSAVSTFIDQRLTIKRTQAAVTPTMHSAAVVVSVWFLLESW